MTAEIIDDLNESQDVQVSEAAQVVDQRDIDLPSNENASQSQEVVEEVPPKFRGKSAKEIAESYLNLEREYGRKAQEIGELRKLTDEILRQQIIQPNSAPAQQQPDVDDSEFFVNPKEAIEKTLAANPKIREFEQLVVQQRQQTALQTLQAKHSDFNEILQDQDFQQWVGSSRIRQQMLMEADQNYNVDAADELFSTYKEMKTLRAAQAAKASDERKAAVASVAVPSGNTSHEGSGKVFRRADLIRLKMTDPARYEAMNDEIIKAYAEGRVK